MMKIIEAVLLIVITLFQRGRVNCTFTVTLDGGFDDKANDVKQTSDGGYIVTGTLGDGSLLGCHFFLSKFHGNGSIDWTTTLSDEPGTEYFECYVGESVQETDDGGFAVAGYIGMFVSGLSYYSKKLGFLSLFGVDGNHVLTHSFQETSYYVFFDSFFSLEKTSDGGYIVTGLTHNWGGEYKNTVWLSKLNSEGTPIWVSTLGKFGFADIGYSVEQTSDEGFIVAGMTEEFGEHELNGLLLSKFDSDGNLVWNVVSIGVYGIEPYTDYSGARGESVQQTSDGGYIVTGSYSYYFLLCKFSSEGTLEWCSDYGVGVGYSVKQTNDDEFIVGGRSGNDVFISKYTSAGNHVWSRILGQSTVDGYYYYGGSIDIAVASEGDGLLFVVTGYFHNVSLGRDSVFLATVSDDPSEFCDMWSEIEPIEILTSPLIYRNPSEYLHESDWMSYDVTHPVVQYANATPHSSFECLTCFGHDSTRMNETCSGFGKCSASDVCVCNENYYGEDCSVTLCDGIRSDDEEEMACSGFGLCVDFDTCDCDEHYFGEFCDVTECFGVFSNVSESCGSEGIQCWPHDTCNCHLGYYGDICNVTSCNGVLSNQTAEVCSSHGKCWPLETCDCDEGYFNEDCDTTICDGRFSNVSSTCSETGECWPRDNCKCLAGYYFFDLDEEKKTICNVTECFDVLSNLTTEVCSSHGVCWPLDTCLCTSNYFGPNCEYTWCNGNPTNESGYCSGRGTCWPYDHCECDETYYFGDDCNITICWGVYSNDSTVVCENRGACVEYNTCECEWYAKGENCSESYICDGIKAENDSYTCSGHGSCIGNDICNCSNGYMSSQTPERLLCGVTTCSGVLSNETDDVCSGHGVCWPYEVCECDADYYGVDCNITLCDGIYSNTSEVCSGHGTCETKDLCECDPGWSSLGTSPNECLYPICHFIPSHEEDSCGVGNCVGKDVCDCENYISSSHYSSSSSYKYLGKDCSTKVGKVLVRSTKHLVSLFYETNMNSLIDEFNISNLQSFPSSLVVRHYFHEEEEYGSFDNAFLYMNQFSEELEDCSEYVFLKVSDLRSFDDSGEILDNQFTVVGFGDVEEEVDGVTGVIYPDSSVGKKYTMYSYSNSDSDLMSDDGSIEIGISVGVCKEVLEKGSMCIELFECYSDPLPSIHHNTFSIGVIPGKESLSYSYAKFYFEDLEDCQEGNSFVAFEEFYLVECQGSVVTGDRFIVFPHCSGDVVREQIVYLFSIFGFTFSPVGMLLLLCCVPFLCVCCFNCVLHEFLHFVWKTDKLIISKTQILMHIVLKKRRGGRENNKEEEEREKEEEESIDTQEKGIGNVIKRVIRKIVEYSAKRERMLKSDESQASKEEESEDSSEEETISTTSEEDFSINDYDEEEGGEEVEKIDGLRDDKTTNENQEGMEDNNETEEKKEEGEGFGFKKILEEVKHILGKVKESSRYYNCCGLNRSLLLFSFFLLKEAVPLYFGSSQFIEVSTVDKSNVEFILVEATMQLYRYIIIFSIVVYLLVIILFVLFFTRSLILDPIKFSVGIGAMKENLYFRFTKSIMLIWIILFCFYCYIIKLLYLEESEQKEMLLSVTFYTSIIIPEILLVVSVLGVLSYNGISSYEYMRKIRSEYGWCESTKVEIPLFKLLKNTDAILEELFQMLLILVVKKRINTEEKTEEEDVYDDVEKEKQMNDRLNKKLKKVLRRYSRSAEHGHLSWGMLGSLEWRDYNKLRELFKGQLKVKLDNPDKHWPWEIQRRIYKRIYLNHRLISTDLRWCKNFCCFPFNVIKSMFEYLILPSDSDSEE